MRSVAQKSPFFLEKRNSKFIMIKNDVFTILAVVRSLIYVTANFYAAAKYPRKISMRQTGRFLIDFLFRGLKISLQRRAKPFLIEKLTV